MRLCSKNVSNDMHMVFECPHLLSVRRSVGVATGESQPVRCSTRRVVGGLCMEIRGGCGRSCTAAGISKFSVKGCGMPSGRIACATSSRVMMSRTALTALTARHATERVSTRARVNCCCCL